MLRCIHRPITKNTQVISSFNNRHMHSQYMNRLQKTKQSMKKVSVDNLIITDPANMYYLTGYNAWSFYVPQAIIISINNKYPYWFGRGIDKASVLQTTRIPENNIIEYADHYVQNPVKHPFELLGQFLKQNNLSNNIGVEADSYYYTAKSHIVLASTLSKSLKDCTNLVNWIRLVKSSYEINSMRIASKISDLVMQTAINNISTDTRQCDIIGEAYKTLIANEFGGEFPALCPIVASGKEASASHHIWNYNTFKQNENIILELAGVHNFYTCPIARTIRIGEKDSATEYKEKVVNEALDAAICAIRPGVTAESVWVIFNDILVKYGIHKESRLGYSVGVGFPPDWGEHTVSFRKGDTTILQENMVFHLIAGLWDDSEGFELSDTILVSREGAERLSSLTREVSIV
jgi:ectoine hydrolase